jgi:tripartite-type tricarboxylate transporter receptor subunit TctC
MRLMHGGLGVMLTAALISSAAAQGTRNEPFYQGKTIRLVISTGVAGGYAEYARVLAEFMPRHIAGRPHVIVQSMPGAGGLLAANFLYTQAPADGTTIGIVHSSVPFAPLWGAKGVRFDTLKFNWLGSLDRVDGMCISWHESPIRTWQDMLSREYTVGSSGAGSQMDTYPAILNRLFGTRIKVIAGYKDGTAVYVAMERGEVDGRCGGQMTVIRSTRPWWITEKKFRVPILIAERRSADFPDTDHHGVRQGRCDAGAARTGAGGAEPRPAGDGAARRSGRACQRIACGVRCHHGRCRIPRRDRAAQSACRSGERRGNAHRVPARLRRAARSHSRRPRHDERAVT